MKIISNPFTDAKLVLEKDINNISIGKIPIMVNSKYCTLNTMKNFNKNMDKPSSTYDKLAGFDTWYLKPPKEAWDIKHDRKKIT